MYVCVCSSERAREREREEGKREERGYEVMRNWLCDYGDWEVSPSVADIPETQESSGYFSSLSLKTREYPCSSLNMDLHLVLTRLQKIGFCLWSDSSLSSQSAMLESLTWQVTEAEFWSTERTSWLQPSNHQETCELGSSCALLGIPSVRLWL